MKKNQRPQIFEIFTIDGWGQVDSYTWYSYMAKGHRPLRWKLEGDETWHTYGICEDQEEEDDA